MDWRNSDIPIAYQPVYNLTTAEPSSNTEYYPDYHELQTLSTLRPLVSTHNSTAQSISSQHPLVSTSPPQQTRDRASAWQRFSPLLAAICAASLSTAPAALYWTGRSFGAGSYLYDVTLNHRTSEQVAVGILASIFSWLWAYALCMSFNLMMRVWLSGKQKEMDLLRLYASISRQAIDLNLSWRYLVLSAAFIGVLLIQSWLWQGALTPDLNTVSKTNDISIVRTGAGSFDFGDAMYIPAVGGIYVNCTRVTQTNGTFTNCPGRELAGAVIDAINTAGNVEGAPRNHSKPDNSGYTYIGRSYGVGARVGLMEEPELGNIEGFEYSEVGYRTECTCIYNDSAAWDLESRFTDNDGGTPNLFLINGDRPNDPPGEGGALGNGYVVPSFGMDPDTSVAVTAGSCCGTKVGDPPFYVSLFGGSFYNFLDKVQCEISFTPTKFDIAVSVDNRTISVSPQQPNSTVEDPEPRGALKEWTLRGLQSLTMVQTTLYMSTVRQLKRSMLSCVPEATDVLCSVSSPAAFFHNGAPLRCCVGPLFMIKPWQELSLSLPKSSECMLANIL